ncbi:MAG: porin [Thiobacillus sp.]
MKKTLIALAVAGTFAAPAFAATSNVDVYGKLHMAVSVFDDQAAANNDVQISSNASRFGLKGSEDLGGGLSGIWQIESSLNLDEQNGMLAARNSFVGLSSKSLGTVLLGNHDTPLKLVGRAVDLFGDTLGDTRNVLGGGSDTRAKNVAVYVSPSFSGLSFAAAYSTDLVTTPVVALPTNNTGDLEDRAVYNLNATYKNGPLFAGLGYGDGDGHEALDLGAHWRAAAAYTLGNLKFVGQYDKLNGDLSTDPDFDAWMLGAAYTMGNVVLKANYMDGDKDGTSADPKQWTIGADYNLSKRTTAYALYANGENLGAMGSRFSSSDAITSGVAGGDISAFSVGVTHSF